MKTVGVSRAVKTGLALVAFLCAVLLLTSFNNSNSTATSSVSTQSLSDKAPLTLTHATPETKSHLSSSKNKKIFRVLTYNVWFDSFHFDERMQHIIHETLALNPDICCFQEVLPQFASALHSNAELNEKYVMSSFTDSGYGTITLARKSLLPSFETVEFPSHMGRSLLKTTVMVNSVRVGVGNVHLESLANEDRRREQLVISEQSLRDYDISVLVGDFNFCSERNFFFEANKPLENEVLKEVLPNYVDGWPYVHKSNIESKRLMGYTFDSEVNKMFRKTEQMRYDRVLTRCNKDICKLSDMALVGVLPLKLEEIESPSTSMDQVWPSDHFGLLATFHIG